MQWRHLRSSTLAHEAHARARVQVPRLLMQMLMLASTRAPTGAGLTKRLE
jgi:hypothetical protein